MLDPHETMHQLSAGRKAFHSEADFQHAFAWCLHERWPDATIRLEYPTTLGAGSTHVDVLAVVAGQRVAIELKYPTRALRVAVADERYALKEHGAQDTGRYDFLRDIERIEAAVQHGVSDRGIAILLTNDSAYWRPNVEGGPQYSYEAFRLHDGRDLHGRLAWGQSAGPGTTRGRQALIVLTHRHTIEWHDYSDISGGVYGRFRFVVIDLAAMTT